MVGGRYYRKGSGHTGKPFMEYKHDIDIMVQVVNRDHPVTRNMPNFTIRDEGYKNLVYEEGIEPLLRTGHPRSSDTIAWTFDARRSEVVYLMLGHDHHAYENPHYRELLRNAIFYTAGRLDQ